MTKNGIRIKKSAKEAFLQACLKNGLKVQKSNVVEKDHFVFIVYFKHIQEIFQAGYYFKQFL